MIYFSGTPTSSISLPTNDSPPQNCNSQELKLRKVLILFSTWDAEKPFLGTNKEMLMLFALPTENDQVIKLWTQRQFRILFQFYCRIQSILDVPFKSLWCAAQKVSPLYVSEDRKEEKWKKLHFLLNRTKSRTDKNKIKLFKPFFLNIENVNSSFEGKLARFFTHHVIMNTDDLVFYYQLLCLGSREGFFCT